jgi:hypothetical protein
VDVRYGAEDKDRKSEPAGLIPLFRYGKDNLIGLATKSEVQGSPNDESGGSGNRKRVNQA